MIRYWEENVEAKIAIPFDIKEHDKELLDKIRAEIQELPIQFTCAHEMQKWALEIIDKYKSESEKE